MDKTYIDPDFRKDPKNGFSQPYCCHCQKSLNTAKKKYVRGTVNWEVANEDGRIWEFKVDANGKDLLGPDCAKVVGIKNNPQG